MGLNLYAYKVKNLESYNKYLSSCHNYNNYSAFLWTKYEKEVNKAYNRYCNWEAEHQDDPDYSLKENPYSYNINNFTTEEEKNNENELMTLREFAKTNCNYHEIESLYLYMRKQYWFIQYLYHKYDDKMIYRDGDVVKTFSGEQFIITKTDLKDIIDRLQRVIDASKNNFDNYYNDPLVYHSLSDELLVNKEIMDKEFPIYNEYIFAARMDWNYNYNTLNSYLNDLKNIYSEMKDEELLVYIESW